MSDAAYIALLLGILIFLGLLRMIVEEVLRPECDSIGELVSQAVGLLAVCAFATPFAYLGYKAVTGVASLFSG